MVYSKELFRRPDGRVVLKVLHVDGGVPRWEERALKRWNFIWRWRAARGRVSEPSANFIERASGDAA